MSSGSPSQIVHDVGGPAAAQAEQLVDRLPDELALQVVERMVECRARRVLARRQAVEDLVERERVVARVDLLEPRDRRVRRLVVVPDRRRLAEAG